MIEIFNCAFAVIAILCFMNGAVLLFLFLGAMLFETFGDWFVGSKLFKITASLFAVPAGLILLMIIIQTIIWTVKLITCGCAV